MCANCVVGCVEGTPESKLEGMEGNSVSASEGAEERKRTLEEHSSNDAEMILGAQSPNKVARKEIPRTAKQTEDVFKGIQDSIDRYHPDVTETCAFCGGTFRLAELHTWKVTKSAELVEYQCTKDYNAEKKVQRHARDNGLLPNTYT